MLIREINISRQILVEQKCFDIIHDVKDGIRGHDEVVARIGIFNHHKSKISRKMDKRENKEN